MATYTWADLNLRETELLADLHGIHFDLDRARNFAKLLVAICESPTSNWELVEPLSIAATVTYSRPFSSGVRHRLSNADLGILTIEQRELHDFVRDYRDKYVAHSVNEFEENTVRATYCEERVKEEGITGLGYGGGRVVSLSGSEALAIVDLANIFIDYVNIKIGKEQVRLLPIIRSMPLEHVLAGGQKAFGAKRENVSSRRKR